MVEELTRIGGMTQTELSEIFKVTQSSISRWMRGAVPGPEVAKKIEALHAKVVLKADSHDTEPTAYRTALPVMGRIVSGGCDACEIVPSEETVTIDGLFEIETDFPLPANAVAFQVEGSSCWPRCRAGDIIVCGVVEDNFADPLGWEAIVRLSNGQRLFRTLRKGSGEGLFDLESHNSPLRRDEQIVSARRVIAIIPFGGWRQTDRAAKTRAARKQARVR